MKKRVTKVTKRLVALLMAFALISFNGTYVMAAETTVPEEVVVVTDEAGEPEAVDEPVPYGSLSGYGQKTDYNSGSFTFNVNGSWSPYAGVTIKTSDFSSSTSLTIGVYDSNGACKTTQSWTGNFEKANIAIFNVPTGTYTVRYSMGYPSSGTIQVWVY